MGTLLSIRVFCCRVYTKSQIHACTLLGCCGFFWAQKLPGWGYDHHFELIAGLFLFLPPPPLFPPLLWSWNKPPSAQVRSTRLPHVLQVSFTFHIHSTRSSMIFLLQVMRWWLGRLLYWVLGLTAGSPHAEEEHQKNGGTYRLKIIRMVWFYLSESSVFFFCDPSRAGLLAWSPSFGFRNVTVR